MSKFRTAFQGFILGAAIVPALGVAAHLMRAAGDNANVGDDYSLKHRFETAYCFNTPDKHKEYTIYPLDAHWNQGEPTTDKYMANPWVMWSLTLACGALGAARALKQERRKPLCYNNEFYRGR